MNRLKQRMEQLKKQGGKAFVAYIMAGEPSWEAVPGIIFALERVGVSAVELGVPFSDPIADGPVIQAAAKRALARGVTLADIFQHVEALRKHTDLPLLLMGYWNVFLQYGRERCLETARSAGVDGFIIADLPPEADPDFFALAGKQDLCTVLLASELTPEDRLRRILASTSGFLYYVPQTGITGLELKAGEAVESRIHLIRSLSETPICIGIGVKTRDDVQTLTRYADGVIVGTRIVEFIHQHAGEPDLPQATARFVAGLIP
ncbi:MAG: tryptophan synthase subunit alpha [Spirochaetaceae bacterium]|nr:MAG: tryptophan synthase subunit alpha [Spirochaetaceae bacterium]